MENFDHISDGRLWNELMIDRLWKQPTFFRAFPSLGWKFPFGVSLATLRKRSMSHPWPSSLRGRIVSSLKPRYATNWKRISLLLIWFPSRDRSGMTNDQAMNDVSHRSGFRHWLLINRATLAGFRRVRYLFSFEYIIVDGDQFGLAEFVKETVCDVLFICWSNVRSYWSI